MATLTLRVGGSPLTNQQMDDNLSNLNNDKVEKNGSTTMTGKLVLAATTSSNANIRLTPSVTDLNPSSPIAGDVWNNQGVIKFRTGFTGSGTGTVNLVTTGDTGTVTNAMLASGIETTKLTANGVTVTAGTGLSGGGAVALGGSITLTNTGITAVVAGSGIAVGTTGTSRTITNSGVTSAVASTGISVNASTGAVTFTNTDLGSAQFIFKNIKVAGQGDIVAEQNNDDLTFAAGSGITLTTNASTDTLTVTNAGVTGITGTANQIIRSAATGSVTLSLPQSIATTSDVQFKSIGAGIAASGVDGEIRATGEVTAYASSDMRLKENIAPINDAISKVKKLSGVEYDWKESALVARGGIDGYFVRRHDVGVIAQQVETVLPELVVTREDGFKAVRYDKMVALLIEAIKEQQKQIDELKAR